MNAFAPSQTLCLPAHGSPPFTQGSTEAEDAVGTGSRMGLMGLGEVEEDEGCAAGLWVGLCPLSELLSWGL